MIKHLFTVGQMVQLTPVTPHKRHEASERTVQIIRPMPAANAHFQYLVRDAVSREEWVVSEDRLQVDIQERTAKGRSKATIVTGL